MTASEIAAVVVAITSGLLVAGVLFALSSFTRTLRTVRTTVEDLNRQATPLLADMRTTVETAKAELARVDEIIGRAESISGTVDSASRLAYLAFSNPVIKAMALGAGTSRAARRLRRGRGSRDEG